MMIKIITAFTFLIVAAGCSQNKTTKNEVVLPVADSAIVSNDSTVQDGSSDRFKEAAKYYYSQLKDGKFDSLISSIPPGESVLFSPYAFIDTIKAKKLTTNEIATALRSGKKIFWGTQEGSGNDIMMDLKAYTKKYVADFILEKTVLIQSDSFHNSGSMVDNTRKIFPGNPIVEFYKPGTEKYGSMNWRSLKIVFKEKDKRIFPIAFIHNEWTP